MKQTKRTQMVTTVQLDSITDCVDLLEWSQTQDGLAVTISADNAGDITVQAEGATVKTVYAHLGDTIVWDGHQFIVDKKEDTQ